MLGCAAFTIASSGKLCFFAKSECSGSRRMADTKYLKQTTTVECPGECKPSTTTEIVKADKAGW